MVERLATVVHNHLVTSSSAQDALKIALRERVGPALRLRGFKGSAPTWTLTSAHGDPAIVNVQSSDSSSRHEVRFTANLAVVPLSWWQWTNHRLGTKESRPAEEYDGLWRERLQARRQQADSRTDWWSVTDAETAARACDDLIDQLEPGAVDELQRLLEPGAMLAEARTGRLGYATYDTRGAIAVLLTEAGPSEELTTLLHQLEVLEDPRLRAVFSPIAQWCRRALQ